MRLLRILVIAIILCLPGSTQGILAKSILGVSTSQQEGKESASSDNQKMNLDPTTTERFPLTGLVWPENVGEANVSLWHMDKIAAASITIDDNIESEHEWWLTMHWIYNLDYTWFIILNSVSSWDKYQALIDAGNEVQGHDNCNINEYDTATYRGELEYTKLQINEHLTSNNCITYAYPCGVQSKQEVARSIYISMRGVTGLLNHANKINYLDLNSRSATNDIHDIRVLLDPSETLYNHSYYRGWASYHYHSISSKKVETEVFLSALSAKSDSIWVGKYSEVARYAQERDSHSLTVTESNDSLIKFSLTDEMKDTYFDFPLTVKIRIDNGWENIHATQGNSSIDAEIHEFQGNKYALVQAVPDQGELTLSKFELNTPPALTPIEDQLVSESFIHTVTIEASDADNDPIILSVENLPEFGLLTDFGDGTGEIKLSPLSGDAGSYDNIIVSASDAMGSSSTSFSLEVEKASSIPLSSLNQVLNIFPNPASDGSFTVTIMEDYIADFSRLDIFSATGQRLAYIATNTAKNAITVSNIDAYQPGLIFVRVMANGRSFTQKVLINQ